MAETTQPSVSTNFRSLPERWLQVSWVFPQPRVTRVSGRHVVGRDESCDSVLVGSEISRRHAELHPLPQGIAVRDLDSSNGLYVNAERVKQAELALGDVLRCGEWVGVVVSDTYPPPPFREIAEGWYGGSALGEVAEAARRIPQDLPLIIQGETGSGKEGMARAAHAWSGRRGPFVAVNCAALPVQLAEAELFGYRKGAFTGAEAASPGLFRAAHGGSLFLDEILDLPQALQPKLLRVLEEREVRALGETRSVAIDVRVIAATQEPLRLAVEQNRFRADLHARLDGLTLVLPPLRARRADVVPLFQQFARQHAAALPALDPKFVEALCVYDWPLNVRELALLVRRLLGLHGHEPRLLKAHLPERVVEASSNGVEPASDQAPADARDSSKRAWKKTDDDREFDALVAALRAHSGSVAKAAAAIGLNRARAYRLLSARPDFSLDELRRGS